MTNQFGIDDIKSNPLFQKRLNSFIEDLILIESHLDEGLLIGKKQLTKRIQEFIQSIEGELPSEVKKHAELFADFNITDPCANPPIPSSIKRMTVKQDPVDFFSIIDGILPSTPKLPRIAACLNELPATSTNPLEDGGPLVIAVGDVVQLASDGGPYYVLVTELIDPQSLKGSFACAYGVRLWTAVDILGLGLPGASDIEEILGEEEVAISGYKDLIRPGTIIHRLRLLPKFWGDPEAMRSLELTFNHYFDYRKLTLSTLDFGLETEPWRILHWMRSLRIASNIAGSWRTFDFLVDRLFHTYSDFFLSFQSPVTGNNELIRLNTIVERDWLLQVPMSVLKTAKFSEDDNGGTLAMWVQTRDEAELMLGPSAHNDTALPNLPNTHYVIKPTTGEPHLDRFRFCIVLPMVLWFCPRKMGETDVLSFQAHMAAMAEPQGTSKAPSHVHWSTENIVKDKIGIN